MTKNLTHEFGKVGCELESSKEERLIRWIRSNDTKHLAKFRSRRLLGPGRFPQTVRHFWMLARNVQAQWSGKGSWLCAPAFTDMHVYGSPDTFLFRSGGHFSNQ